MNGGYSRTVHHVTGPEKQWLYLQIYFRNVKSPDGGRLTDPPYLAIQCLWLHFWISWITGLFEKSLIQLLNGKIQLVFDQTYSISANILEISSIASDLTTLAYVANWKTYFFMFKHTTSILTFKIIFN